MSTTQRIVAAVTAFLFFGNSVLTAAPALETAAVSSEVRPAIADFSIPEELGQIEEVYRAPAGGPSLIVHIQDAHGNAEAQRNIAGLIEHLRRDENFRLLFLEGAPEKLDPSLFRFFDDPALNLNVADQLLERGQFSGAERFLLEAEMRGEKVAAYGIEDPAVYRTDIDLFRNVLKARKKSRRLLRQLDSRTDLLESRLFSKQLKAFVREWRIFRKEQSSFLRYIETLSAAAKDHLQIDLEESRHQDRYPSLLRIAKLRKLESKLDLKKAAAEKEAFCRFLEGLGNPALDGGVIARVREVEKEKMPRLLFEKLAEILGEDADFGPFPQFSLYVRYLMFKSEIESKAVFDEAERLSEEIMERLAESAEAKSLVQIMKDIYGLEKLFALELARDDYRRITEERAENVPSRIEGRLAELASAQQIRIEPAEAAALDPLYESALEFYRFAQERETHFLEKAFARMKEENEPRVILVTGGFHSRGIREKLEARGVSYISISPRISQAGDAQKVYLKAMLGGRQFQKSQISNILQLMDLAEQEQMGAFVQERVRDIIESIVRAGRSRGYSGADILREIADSGFVSRNRITFPQSLDSALLEVVLSDGARLRVPVPPAAPLRAASLGETTPAAGASTGAGEEEAKVRAIFAQYNLGEITNMRPLAEGLAKNRPWYIETGAGRYVMTQKVLRKTPDLMRWEQTLFDGLRARRFQLVPQVQLTTEGRPYVEQDGALFALYEHKRGNQAAWGGITDAKLDNAAKAQARYHNAVRGVNPEGQNLSNTERLYPLSDLLDFTPLREFLQRARSDLPGHIDAKFQAVLDLFIANFDDHTIEGEIQKLAAAAPAGGYANLPQLIIHGDYNPNNLLFRGSQVSGLIDFDYARLAPRVMDLANGAINIPWPETPDQPLDVSELVRYLRAYQSAAGEKLSAAELSILPQLYRSWFLEGIAMVLYRMASDPTAPAEQLLGILQGNLKNFQVLDQSLARGDWQPVFDLAGEAASLGTVLNIDAIAESLRRVQENFTDINAELEMQREFPEDRHTRNMIAAYTRLDEILAAGEDLTPERMHELNVIARWGIAGVDYEVSDQWKQIKSAREYFFGSEASGFKGGADRIAPWYDRFRRFYGPYYLSSGLYTRGLSRPQAFSEGNHRTGGLLLSYILVNNGLPPFVLNIDDGLRNAIDYLDISGEIKFTNKDTLWGKFSLWRYGGQFRSFLKRQIEQSGRYLRQPAVPGAQSLGEDMTPSSLRRAIEEILDIQFHLPYLKGRPAITSPAPDAPNPAQITAAFNGLVQHRTDIEDNLRQLGQELVRDYFPQYGFRLEVDAYPELSVDETRYQATNFRLILELPAAPSWADEILLDTTPAADPFQVELDDARDRLNRPYRDGENWIRGNGWVRVSATSQQALDFNQAWTRTTDETVTFNFGGRDYVFDRDALNKAAAWFAGNQDFERLGRFVAQVTDAQVHVTDFLPAPSYATDPALSAGGMQDLQTRQSTRPAGRVFADDIEQALGIALPEHQLNVPEGQTALEVHSHPSWSNYPDGPSVFDPQAVGPFGADFVYGMAHQVFSIYDTQGNTQQVYTAPRAASLGAEPTAELRRGGAVKPKAVVLDWDDTIFTGLRAWMAIQTAIVASFWADGAAPDADIIGQANEFIKSSSGMSETMRFQQALAQKAAGIPEGTLAPDNAERFSARLGEFIQQFVDGKTYEEIDIAAGVQDFLQKIRADGLTPVRDAAAYANLYVPQIDDYVRRNLPAWKGNIAQYWVPGALQFIEGMRRAQVPLYIISGGTSLTRFDLAAEFGIRDLFQGVQDAASPGFIDKATVLRQIEAQHADRKGELVMVGDGVGDIKAAAAVNAVAVALVLNPDMRERMLAENPHMVFTNGFPDTAGLGAFFTPFRAPLDLTLGDFRNNVLEILDRDFYLPNLPGLPVFAAEGGEINPDRVVISFRGLVRLESDVVQDLRTLGEELTGDIYTQYAYRVEVEPAPPAADAGIYQRRQYRLILERHTPPVAAGAAPEQEGASMGALDQARAELRAALADYLKFISQGDNLRGRVPDVFFVLGNPDFRAFLEFSRMWQRIRETKNQEVPLVLAGGRGRGTLPLIEAVIAHYGGAGQLQDIDQMWLEDAKTNQQITEADVLRFIFTKEGVTAAMTLEKVPSTNTTENFTNNEEIMAETVKDKKDPVIGVVSSPPLNLRIQARGERKWKERIDSQGWRIRRIQSYRPDPRQWSDAQLIETTGYLAGYPPKFIEQHSKLNANNEIQGTRNSQRAELTEQDKLLLGAVQTAFEKFLDAQTVAYDEAKNLLVPAPAAAQAQSMGTGAGISVAVAREQLEPIARNMDWRTHDRAKALLAAIAKQGALSEAEWQTYREVIADFAYATGREKTWFNSTDDGKRLDGTTVGVLSLEAFMPDLYNGQGGLGMLVGDWIQEAFARGASGNYMPTLPLYRSAPVSKVGAFGEQVDNFRYNWGQLPDGSTLSKQDYLQSVGAKLLTYPEGHEKAGQDVVIKIRVPAAKEEYMYLKVWQAAVDKGFVTLLDADIPENTPHFRKIFEHPYHEPKSEYPRFIQQWALGVGYIELLHELGIDPEKALVVHANETGTAMAIPALVVHYMRKGYSYDEAVFKVRNSIAFTTHTLVPAGFDTFNPEKTPISDHIRAYAEGLGIQEAAAVAGWLMRGKKTDGRFINAGIDTGVGEWQNTGRWAIGFSWVRNAVSQLNAVKATRQLEPLLPEDARYASRPDEQKGYEPVTNGVARYWFPRWIREAVGLQALDRGEVPEYEKILNPDNPDHRWLWSQIFPDRPPLETLRAGQASVITDEQLAQDQRQGAAALVDFLRQQIEQSDTQSLQSLNAWLAEESGDVDQNRRRKAFLDWRIKQIKAQQFFDAEKPIFVWARRVVEYKRMLQIVLGEHLDTHLTPRIHEILRQHRETTGRTRPITIREADQLIDELKGRGAFDEFIKLLERGSQFIMAGKAFDDYGKSQIVFLQRLLQRAYEDGVNTQPAGEGERRLPFSMAKQVVFLPGYTEHVARYFAAGATAYIATSEVPWEASGTSPMKPLKPVIATPDGYERTHIVNEINGWLAGKEEDAPQTIDVRVRAMNDATRQYFREEAADIYLKMNRALDVINGVHAEDKGKWLEMRRAVIFSTFTQLEVGLSLTRREVIDLPATRKEGRRIGVDERGYFQIYADVADRSRAADGNILMTRGVGATSPIATMTDRQPKKANFSATYIIKRSQLNGLTLDPLQVKFFLHWGPAGRPQEWTDIPAVVQALEATPDGIKVEVSAEIEAPSAGTFEATFFATMDYIPEPLRLEFAKWQAPLNQNARVEFSPEEMAGQSLGSRDVRGDLIVKLKQAFGEDRYSFYPGGLASIDVIQKSADKYGAIKDLFAYLNLDVLLYFGDEFFSTEQKTGNDTTMLKAVRELAAKGKKLVVFSVDVDPAARSAEAMENTIWIGSGRSATKKVLAEILRALAAGETEVTIRGEGMDAQKSVTIDLGQLRAKGALAFDADGTLISKRNDFSNDTELRELFLNLLNQQLNMGIISGNKRAKQRERIITYLQSSPFISKFFMYINGGGATRLTIDGSGADLVHNLVPEIPRADLETMVRILLEAAPGNFGMTGPEITALKQWFGITADGQPGRRPDVPNVEFRLWEGWSGYQPDIVDGDAIVNARSQAVPLAVSQPFIELRDGVQAAIQMLPFGLEIPETASSMGTASPDTVPDEIAAFLRAENRTPAAMIRIADSADNGGLADGVIFVRNEKVLRWAMERLGLAGNAARAARNQTDFSAAFNRGELDTALLAAAGIQPDARTSDRFPLVVFSDDVIRGGQKEAEAIADSLHAEDLLIIVRGQNTENEAIDKLIREAARNNIRVKTLPADLASGTLVGSLTRAFDIPPISISSLRETKDLEVSFNNIPVKLKLNLAELSRYGIDPVKVIGLVRQLADHPEKFRQIGFTDEGQYLEVGSQFAQFLMALFKEAQTAKEAEAALQRAA